MKWFCSKCNHESETKGFCPVDGSELTDTKSSSSEVQKLLDSVLPKMGEVVEAKVRQTMKDYGFEQNAGGKKILPGSADMSRDERMKVVKGLLEAKGNEHDLKTFENCSDEKEKNEFMKKARVAYFFKHVVAFQLTKDPAHLEIVKALSEGDNASGGYLTPTEFRAELVRDMRDKPFLRNLVTVVPMASDALEIPTLASDVQVSWGSENTAISTTTARFGTLTFAPKRLNTFMYTSRELMADSAIGVVQMITTLFVEAMGREEDRVIIAGSGSGQPTGILTGTVAGIDNANVDANLAVNIKKLPFRLPKAYRLNARWLMNSLAAEHISALQDATTSQFLIRNMEGKGLEEATLAGYPIEEQNDMPVDTLLFGDLKKYYLADREQISVETTTEGAGTFEKHQVAIKVVERIDGKMALANAFRKITNCGID